MWNKINLVYTILFLTCSGFVNGIDYDDDFYNETFPNDFLWGTATSACQIEAAWIVDGRVILLTLIKSMVGKNMFFLPPPPRKNHVFFVSYTCMHMTTLI